MIQSKTRAEIKGYLEGFVRGLVEQHRPQTRGAMTREDRANYSSKEGVLKPFHEAIIPAEVIRLSEFERSFSTKLGTTFEECARLIALQTFKHAQRGFRTKGMISVTAGSRIEQLVAELGSHKETDFLRMVELVLDAQGTEMVERVAIADLYLLDEKEHEHFFEIKSPKPNKGQCLEITERLLRIHAMRRATRPQVSAYFAMGYNPYGMTRTSYTHSFSLQYLDMKNQVLLGPEFWSYIGGDGTYEELLEVYREVGREMSKTIVDALAFGY